MKSEHESVTEQRGTRGCRTLLCSACLAASVAQPFYSLPCASALFNWSGQGGWLARVQAQVVAHLCTKDVFYPTWHASFLARYPIDTLSNTAHDLLCSVASKRTGYERTYSINS